MKLRSLIKYYHNAFSALSCTAPCPGQLIDLGQNDPKILCPPAIHLGQEWQEPQNVTLDVGWGCEATEGIPPLSPPQPRLLEAAGAWLDPSPALCPTESEVRGRRCCAHALHISNHDMTSVKLWGTEIKWRKKPFSRPPETSATEDWNELLEHRVCPSSAHPCLCQGTVTTPTHLNSACGNEAFLCNVLELRGASCPHVSPSQALIARLLCQASQTRGLKGSGKRLH